jgi:hypothetical protein
LPEGLTALFGARGSARTPLESLGRASAAEPDPSAGSATGGSQAAQPDSSDDQGRLRRPQRIRRGGTDCRRVAANPGRPTTGIAAGSGMRSCGDGVPTPRTGTGRRRGPDRRAGSPRRSRLGPDRQPAVPTTASGSAGTVQTTDRPHRGTCPCPSRTVASGLLPSAAASQPSLPSCRHRPALRGPTTPSRQHGPGDAACPLG